MTAESPVLRISDLCVAREGAQVVRNFSLRIEGSEDVVAILGPNGAGKSSVVDGICGFAEKTAGEVILDGKDVTNQRPAHLARMGLIQVSQYRDLFPGMTVEDNVILGREAVRGRGGQNQILDEILDVFPILHERWSQRVGSLSGGEQQMVAIARALAGEPKVLLLDEPTSGLAPVIVDRLVSLLSRLRDRALVLVLIEQNIGVALEICSRFLILRGGDTVFEGDLTELGPNPADFIAARYV